ncbi:MAG: hypothetical protein U9Q07_11870, partial [Planctomycetota bacterium]|nr:hypothetical protein [Planctomycetota bacterium]
VGQTAKQEGCRVVGIAGGPEKCRYVVEELGFDACIDYKAGNLTRKLTDLLDDVEPPEESDTVIPDLINAPLSFDPNATKIE